MRLCVVVLLNVIIPLVARAQSEIVYGTPSSPKQIWIDLGSLERHGDTVLVRSRTRVIRSQGNRFDPDTGRMATEMTAFWAFDCRQELAWLISAVSNRPLNDQFRSKDLRPVKVVDPTVRPIFDRACQTASLSKGAH